MIHYSIAVAHDHIVVKVLACSRAGNSCGQRSSFVKIITNRQIGAVEHESHSKSCIQCTRDQFNVEEINAMTVIIIRNILNLLIKFKCEASILSGQVTYKLGEWAGHPLF